MLHCISLPEVKIVYGFIKESRNRVVSQYENIVFSFDTKRKVVEWKEGRNVGREHQNIITE